MFLPPNLVVEGSNGRAMNAEDLEQFETGLELALYLEYRDVLPMFRYFVKTDRRSCLCNSYEVLHQRGDGGAGSRSS